MRRKILTLCVIHQEPRVLLGMKKKGFGAGRWNGFGGKVEEGETIEGATRRELREEAGIDAHDLEKVGTLDFSFASNPDEILEVHIFRSTRFSGQPKESDEMRPAWFSQTEIPFEEMWPDDRHWFPLLLAGKKFNGRFHFGEGDAILEQELVEVTMPSAA